MIIKNIFARVALHLFLCCFSMILGIANVAAQAVSSPKGVRGAPECSAPKQEHSAQFTTEVNALAESFLKDLKSSERFKDHRIRILRTISDQSSFESGQNRNKAKVSVMVFDYTINKALFFTIVNPTKELISEERLSGRPQPSEQEIEEARKLVTSEPMLSSFLQGDTKIVGGFIVDGPPKSPPDHRYMQMRIVSGDMKRTKKVVIVDLSKGMIVSN